MSAIHPLAIVDTASISSLVRIMLYHHSIRVCHTKVEMEEGVAGLGEKARSRAAANATTRLVSDIPMCRV